MAKVIITHALKEEIHKRFKHTSVTVFQHLYSLQNNPKKGKVLSQVKGILVKELKYKKYRFYFLVDGYKIKFLQKRDLDALVIKIVRMSEKNNQQQAIDEIKSMLKKLDGDTSF